MRDRSRTMYHMNSLNTEDQAHVIAALVEGNSIRSVERMTGIHRDTIMRLRCVSALVALRSWIVRCEISTASASNWMNCGRSSG